MSQIYKSLTSGPVPPAVPTQFTTDDGSIAIPASNNLNVFSQDTTENNANGIQTRAIAPNSENLFIEITNRTRVIATTSDGGGQTQTVNIFTPTSASAITFVVTVTGYDSTNNEMIGGELVGIARRSSGGTTAVVGTNDTFIETDIGLIAADYDIVTDGTLIQFQCIGVAGRTINWSSVFVYDQIQ